ncbi:MAG TPA: VPLPA-CTERM sorting domain-containing protein [Verrucomicrobiae bacterium]|nr:VPLPA-CTERM sorting domain-containing protein [Verrucomicrobiae bacterium]
MKTSIGTTALAVIISIGSCTTGFGSVYSLSPGGVDPALGSAYPMGGTTLASLNTPFNSGSLLGTLTSQVISGDTSNPYAGGLTFTYQLSISPSSPDGATELSASSFAGYLTDVSYNNAVGSQVAPSFFSRSSSGDVVHSVWLYQPVGPGQDSTMIVVQTDATAYQASMVGLIDGLTVNVSSFAPVPVPEPAIAGLLLAGLGVFSVVRRRQCSR